MGNGEEERQAALLPTYTHSLTLLVQSQPLSRTIHVLILLRYPRAFQSLSYLSLGNSHPLIHRNPNHQGIGPAELEFPQQAFLIAPSQFFSASPASYSICVPCYLYACYYYFTFLIFNQERGKRQRDIAEKTQSLKSWILVSTLLILSGLFRVAIWSIWAHFLLYKIGVSAEEKLCLPCISYQLIVCIK